jgi:hypothetical protein
MPVIGLHNRSFGPPVISVSSSFEPVKVPVVVPQSLASESELFLDIPNLATLHGDTENELYGILRKYARFLKEVSALPGHEERVKKQWEVENRFIRVLKLLQSKFGIRDLKPVDCTTTIVECTSKGRSFQSQPFIAVPNTGRMPSNLAPKLRQLYLADCARSVTDVEHVLCAVSGLGDEIAQVRYSECEMSYELMLGHMHTQIGFFLPATSMATDGARIWVAGDVRVKAFVIDSLETCDTLFVPDFPKAPVPKTGLAIWGPRVVLGVNSDLYSWHIRGNSAAEAKHLDRATIQIPASLPIDDSRIDLRMGREPVCRDHVPELPLIDSVCGVEEYLIVASSKYPVIYVMTPTPRGELRIVTRLVGHTMGVTCLLPYRTDQVFSGSFDKTIKLWNVATGQLLFAFHRHNMAVSTLHLSHWKNADDMPEGILLFSGGQDSTVRAWDILRKRSLFEISVGGNLCPTAINFVPEANELSILALPIPEGPADGSPSAADLGQFQVYRFGEPG